MTNNKPQMADKISTCSKCGSTSWGAKAPGRRCDMPIPYGNCDGRMEQVR